MNFLKIKKEEIKKVFILIFLIFVLFGLYFLQNSNKKSPADESLKEKPTQQSTLQVPSEEVQKFKIEQEFKKAQVQTYMPANKAALAKLALQSAGKQDPFTQQGLSASKIQPFPKAMGSSSVPPPPSLNNLPFPLPNQTQVSGQPLAPPPIGSLDSPSMQFSQQVNLKGFIGDKAILDINGTTKAFKSGDRYGMVEIIDVDSLNKKVKIKDDGKVIIKQMEKLDTTDLISQAYRGVL